jgi:hypothetical protein
MREAQITEAYVAAFLLMSAAVSTVALGQAAPTPGLTTPAQSVGLYVFPQKEQTPAVQQEDEGACYGAAKTASGVDPANPKPANVQVQEGSGGGVRGAARGAAGGAAIGAIAGDAGTGAAAGAAVGVVRGARGQKQANEQAQAQAAAHAAQVQQDQMNSFKRAMTACLESRNYSVK